MIGDNEACIKHLEQAPKGMYKVTRIYQKRTKDQNAYLHVIFDIMAEKTGDDPEVIKEVMKSKFLKQYNPTFDEVYPKKTSKLTSVEISHFIDNIKIFCSEFLDLEIPNAEDYRLLDYYDKYGK